MSDDGELLVTGDFGRTYLWRTDLGEVFALACEKLSSDLRPEERTLYAIQDDEGVCS